jgi:hypothetical protein
VYFPLRYYRRPRGLEDPHTYAQLTRFLPVAVRERFEERSTFAPSDQDQASELVSAGSPDVATFLDGLWAE